MAGKGNHHVVSVLIPDDCVTALKKLAESEVRKDAGILSTNILICHIKFRYISFWVARS